MKTAHYLPNDVTRCHDEGCPEREKCSRWVRRQDVADVVKNSVNVLDGKTAAYTVVIQKVVHSASLYPYEERLLPCPHMIESVMSTYHDGDEKWLDDGFGNRWLRRCEVCGAEREIVRPGKVQCPNCE